MNAQLAFTIAVHHMSNLWKNISQFLYKYNNPFFNVLEIYHVYQCCVMQDLNYMGNKGNQPLKHTVLFILF
jgi:hypothetical protein